MWASLVLLQSIVERRDLKVSCRARDLPTLRWPFLPSLSTPRHFLYCQSRRELGKFREAHATGVKEPIPVIWRCFNSEVWSNLNWAWVKTRVGKKLTRPWVVFTNIMTNCHCNSDQCVLCETRDLRSDLSQCEHQVSETQVTLSLSIRRWEG